jgi:hypothetical protein
MTPDRIAARNFYASMNEKSMLRFDLFQPFFQPGSLLLLLCSSKILHIPKSEESEKIQ